MRADGRTLNRNVHIIVARHRDRAASSQSSCTHIYAYAGLNRVCSCTRIMIHILRIDSAHVDKYSYAAYVVVRRRWSADAENGIVIQLAGGIARARSLTSNVLMQKPGRSVCSSE